MNDDYLFPFYQGIRGLVVIRAWEVGTQEKLRRQRARVTQLVWMAKSEDGHLENGGAEVIEVNNEKAKELQGTLK